MNNANKLALGLTPLITLGFSGFLWFTFSVLRYLFSDIDANTEICWGAGILAAICYGFIIVSTNQLNIHSDNIEKHEKVS